MNEPVKTGPKAGTRLERTTYDQALDCFYRLNGWDPKTSWQTAGVLQEMELDEVARRLSEGGKLPD